MQRVQRSLMCTSLYRPKKRGQPTLSSLLSTECRPFELCIQTRSSTRSEEKALRLVDSGVHAAGNLDLMSNRLLWSGLQMGGRIFIKVKRPVRMGSQRCGRKNPADGILQRATNRGLLKRSRNTAKDAVGLKQTRNGKRQCVSRNIFKPLEASVIDLLLTACGI